PRGLSRPHQGARPPPLAPSSKKGGAWASVPTGADPISTLHQKHSGGIRRDMSIVEAEHPAGVPVSVSVEIGGKEITFETGKLAKQADGSVIVRSGDTVVLGTAQGRTEAREGADFFPLTVDVEERMYAAGKIPGGFFKREGRPTERAILTARMTDRPVRPLWPKGYRNEVQCVATVFSVDMVTPHDILCINAVSAALTISPLPFLGPIGAVRMGLIDGELVVNPTLEEVEHSSDLDLIVVGTKDGLTMVEAGANQVPEEKLLEALGIALAEILEKQRSVAAETAVREQFEGDLRGLTDAEQDSKELKSAKRSILYDRIVETVKLPFPGGAAEDDPSVKDTFTKGYVKKA